MAGTKQRCAIYGSMLVAVAAGFTALAEDSTVLSRDVPVSEQSEDAFPPAPVDATTAPPVAATYDTASSIPYPPQQSPPRRSPGWFGRFKQRCRAKYWGYPEEFLEPPLGSMVLGNRTTQIAKGQAARMALYQYDFLPDSEQLNARGKTQLGKIALLLPTNNFPVFVESTTANAELDELRRQTIWNELSCDCLSIPPERIIVGGPNVRGIGGVESLLIDRNRLTLTGARGVSSTGGGTSGTSTSAAGTIAR